ncbi:unnamed protein product, partial [Rotaria sp. Silwood1]
MSPSPPSSHKRQNQTAQQSLINTHSLKQPSSLISSNNTNKRYRPSQSLSLTRTNNFQHVRQYPMKLEIFKPSSTNNREYEKQTTIIRNYDYEIQNRQRSSSENKKQQYKNDFNMEQEYLRCLNDVKNEYENLQREKKSFDNRKNKTTYETTKQYENVEKTYHHHHHHQPRSINKIQNNISNQTETNNTCQRSLSETLLHKNFKPIIKTDITLSDENLKAMEYCLQHQQRLIKPIHIHSSANFIPGERSIKYVHTERSPVEIILPKPQITKTHEEHTSAIVKDIRNTNRGTMTTIHQKPRSRSIEGERELRIFQKPIETLPIEQLSTNVIKSKTSDHLHTFNLNNTLTRQRTLSGEYKFRRIPEPMQTNLYNQQVNLLFPKSTHHSSTIVKQNRIPKSSIVLDNIQTKLKGEHDLRLVDKPIQAGPSNSVELVVPKSITKIPEHTTTIVTEQQPHRRVLQVTGSGKKQKSEHETKYFHDTVRIEEEIEVKLPKTKLEQVEHSATIIKHNRGKAPIIEIDATQKKIEGEHLIKILNEPIETTPDTMQLLVKKPKLSAEYSTTMIKEQHKQQQQILTTDRTQPIPAEHQTRYHDRPIESYEKMDVSFSQQQPMHRKPFIYDDRRNEILHQHSLTLIDNSNYKTDKGTELISSKQPKGRFVDHYKSANDHNERFVSSTINEEETISEHKTTYLKQTHPKYGPVELVVDRPTILPSVSKLIADIPALPQITSIKSTEILSSENNSIEFNSNSYKSYEQYDEMEIIDEKPSIHDSSKILITNIQPSKPTPYLQQPIEDSSTSLTMELNRNQQIEPFELIIPRIDMESSTSTILADVSPVIAGLHAKIDIPSNIEKLTSSYIFEQTKPLNNEIELIMPKPKHIETSTSTMIADVQAKLETKDIRPNEIQPETSTTTYYFDKTIDTIIPEPVELRMKQPIIGDSSTTVIAKVASPLDTKPIQLHTNTYRPLEHSLSTMPYETIFQQNQSSNIESILSRPQTQESTSITLTDIQPTFNTSQKYIIVAPPLENPLESSSQMILEENNIETETVELNSYQQSSSHTPLAKLDDTSRENEVMYVLGFDNQQQQQQQYAPSTILANLNKPVEFVFNVENDNTSEISQQYRQDYSTRMVTSAMDRITNGATSNTEIVPTQFKPIEFIVSGGLTGYNNAVEQYTTGDDGSYTTTTTTTKRIITSSDKPGYETINRSVVRGIRPFDQVDLVLQPDTSISSTSSKILTTSVGLDSNHAPYFVLSLRDQTAKEGESVLFEVIVSAQPSAEIVWDKDGTLIGDDSAFRIDYYGDGRATLYIPEAFFDDQGYYTCTATNSLGTCRTTARLTMDSAAGISPKRRPLTDSSMVYYEQGPTQVIRSYQVYSQPSTTITEVTEQTQVYEIPGQQQQQQNQITYTIEGTQPKFQPVSFLVSTSEENQQPTTRTRITTDEENQSITFSPYQNFISQLRTRPNQGVLPSYGDETRTTTTTTVYSQQQQQQPRSSGLIATVAKQPGPAITQYQQSYSQELEDMQTESETSMVRAIRSTQQQPTSTSYISTRPTFTKPLEPINALEGGTIQITVHLTSVGPHQTRPQIQWYHHAQPIVSDDIHYRIIEGYETSTLEIINITKGDSGQVWCVANTPAGSATTTCTINVEENPVRTYHHIIPSQQVVPQETTYGVQSTHLTHAQIPLHHQQPEQRVPTQFYSTQTITQQEVSPQTFTTQSYISFPSKQIPSEPYVTQQSSIQVQQVPTHPVTPQQQPPMSPQPSVPQAPALLPNFSIRPAYSDQQIKILNNGLQDQPLYPGGETVFECQFSGQPEKIQWFHNEVEIIYNPQQVYNRVYHITNIANGTTRLIIRSTLEEDVGTYSVKLTGPNREETSSAKLISALQFQNIQKKKVEQTQRKALVQEIEEKQVKRMRPSQPILHRGSFPSYGTSDDDVFYDTTQRTAASHRQPTVPTIKTPLKDTIVKEGQPIHITCQIQGFPKSELFWFKNNVPLPLSARHKIAYDAGSGTITLRIHDSRPEDSGIYTVIAKNPQGHVQTSAHIDIQETPAIDETSYVQPDAFKYIEKQPVASRPQKPRRESDTTNLQQKPAKILRTPLSTSVVEGTVAQFTCQVEGNPKPKIAWLKDNKPLMSGTRFTTYFDQTTKTAVLRITDVCKEDQGYYTCIVDNPLNSDRSTATLQVVPEVKVDQRSYVETDAFKYLAQENKQRLTVNKDVDRSTSGVETESFVSPESFRYLEAKKPTKQVDDNIAIDDRPIVDLEAIRYLEARQASKVKKDTDVRASIDDTPIIAPDAFRYLERKTEAAKIKKDQDIGPLIDETPQVDLTAFQYLERKGIPKKVEESGPKIDESSIVNPEAFKYLERKPIKKVEDVGPLIDETPIVNPNAFRYLERQAIPQVRDTAPAIDTTPLVNPEVFKYLERPSEPTRVDEGPSIDTRPIVPQEAFRWLDRPKPVERIPEGPVVDESSYVNIQAFRYIEAKPKTKVIDEGPTVDESAYVNPQAFRYLEAPLTKKHVDEGPVIDTSTYVNPELFAHFELKPAPQKPTDDREIKRVPRVIQPLRNTQANEGKPIALVAIVDGYPVPQLTWLKDGAELPASTRVTTNYDIPSKTAWIRIDSVRPDDTAVYTLIAHNPAGDVRSDARLNVVPSMTPIDDTAFVPAEAFAKIERATTKRPNIPETTGVDDTSFINPELFRQFELPLKQSTEKYTDEVVIQVPARIIAPLKSIQAPDNVTVVLEAIVEGSPIPTFTWLKDQLPLSESNRFITNYDLPSKHVTLTIKDVRESDTGVYTLLVSNGPQLHHSSATLHIIGAPSIDQSSFIPMDVFKQLEHPQSQQKQIIVQAGVDQTSYISQPDRFAVFDQILPHKRPLNEFGGVDETPLINMEKIRLLEIPSNQAKQPYDIEEKVQAPNVLAPLQPIDAQEGSPVVLTAKIDGTPMPNVTTNVLTERQSSIFTWFKDDAPLVASSRFTTYYDIPSKLIILQINDARPNDTGIYTVRADNKSGTVTTSATLHISSLPSIRDQSFISTDKFYRLEQGNQPRFIEETSGVDERPLVDLTKLQQLEIKPNKFIEEEQPIEQFKPSILIPLRNVQAVENQPVVLSAQIQGKPQPQFVWFKNNQPLSEGNRFRTHYDIPSKTIFLTIAGAREDDSAIYRLIAQNPSGQDETSCEVHVNINQPIIDQRSFVPQTAFEKLEKPMLKPSDVTSGVDQTSFFNQELFRPFDEQPIKHTSAIVGGEESEAVMPITAPKIFTPLRPITTSEGNTVLLTVQVEGYPLPQFTWFLNNQPLMASNRVTSHYDMLTKRCFLQILDSRPSDTGTYELIAENPAGQDRTKTELTIVPVSKIDQTGYVPYDKFSTLEFKPRIPSDLRSGVDATPFVSGEIFRLLEAKHINEPIVPEEEQNLPLEVLVPLKLAVAQEGQPVILTTKIRGRPVPQFTWLRNNQPLLESNRFQTHYDFPSETLVLEISDIWPHDSGNYTVIAHNPKTGERAETSAPLVVRSDTTPVDYTAFVAPDAFRTLEAGPNLRTVFVEPGVDTQSFLTPDVLKTLDQVKPKPMDVDEKEQPRIAPKVVVHLQPIKCNEGQPINFIAKVEGNPHPVFTWFKNDQPLQESNRFWTHHDVPSKTVLLQINGARPDDSGKYVLVAKNPLGQDQTQTTVNVTFGPAIDTNAFVSPEKFAAFDLPYTRHVPLQSGVDTTPFVQPERFTQLELKAPAPTKEEMEHMEAPKIVTPLQSVQVNEGSPVLLQATIVGKPRPNFVWLKDNVPLVAGNRLRTRYDIATKQVLLQINDVRPQDIGEYVVIATNPAGQDSTICSVNVVPDKKGVDERAFVPQDKFRNLEAPEGKGRRPLEIVPGVDVQPFVSPEKFRKLDHVEPVERPERELQEPKRAPRVLAPLSNCDLEELMPVLLTTTIDAGMPMATFTWFKNGQPLLEGNRFTTKYDILTKTLTLQVLAARPDDQGTYTVRVTNPSGTDETTCKLTIRPIASIDTRPFVQPERFAQLELKAPAPTKEDMKQMEAPKVIVPLQSVQVNEGSPVLFQATIVGKPRPNFVWLKDNKPLAAGNRLRTRYDIATKQVLLQIDDVRPQDIGEYVVIATNPAGQESTICSLNVVPDKKGVDEQAFVPQDKFRNLEYPEGKGRRPLEIVPGVDVQPFVSPEKFRKLDHVEPVERPERELQEPKRAPRVISPLINCELEELMPVLLTTTIDAGVPMATFTWFKNGQPLLEGNRFTTKYDIYTKTLTLQVLAARPDDQGTYTVRVTNPSGTDETTCKLTIRPIASIDTRPFIQPEYFTQLELKAPAPTKEDMKQMEAPKVVVPLKSVQVNEGSPILLQAKIVGKPTPNFVWLKDGAPLAAGNRLRTRYDIGTKQVLLQIDDVRPQDIGEYVVIATNPAGQDSTICLLNVLPDKPGVDDRAFIPQDKFRNLEAPEGKGKRPLEIIPGVDVQPFVSPDKFRKLDHVEPVERPERELQEPKRAPRVIAPLSNCDLEELMPVLLTTTIDAGVPMASFTWYKNNKPLLEGNRFTTKYDILTKVLTLQVLAARPDDQGTYTVRATNPSGTDETTCKLTIRPIASIDTRPFIQPDHFAQLELKAPVPTKEDMDHMEPPKVIVPLKPVQVNEGSPILLQAKIVGKPTPNFVWLKDNVPLAAGNRLRTRYDIGTKQVLLQIDDVRPNDTGEYHVIATNPAGQDSTICSVNVVPEKPGVDERAFVPQDKFRNLEHPEGKGRRPLEIIPGVDVQPFVSPEKFRKLDHVEPVERPERELQEPKRAPRVISPLINCELEELMPVILTSTIDAGVPMASFTWYKNGQPLLEGNRFTTKYDIYTKTLTLQILAARPDDIGTYTVRATNPSGSDETTCKLTIRPIASIDTRPFIQPETFAQLELKAPAPTKEEMEHMEPPKVVVPLKSLQVDEGAPVLLQATITGKPRPKFVWLKDNKPLAASNRLRTRYDIATKQVLLQIDDVRPHDIGEYVVVATNPAGEDSTICSLGVVPDKTRVDERPFVPQDKFRSLEAPEGKGPRPLEIVPGVDVQPFVSPDKFRKLDHVEPSAKQIEEVPEPKRAPRVIVPLSNCELEELMPVLLTTTIDAGVPMATFTWYKNNKPLLEGNRFTTKYDIVTKVLTLQVLAARPNDQGTYTVRATNPSGSDETTCKLTIRPVASIDTRPYIQPERFAQLELQAPAPTKEEMEHMEPPKVIVPLEPKQVKEGSPVLLQATITGKPRPNFVWLKDNKPLTAGNRLRTRYDIATKQVLLQINDVRPQDVGEYRVIATNPAGKDSTVGSLNVVPDKPGVDDRPFVPQDKFRSLEAPEGKGPRPLEIVPGVDIQPFVSPDKFRKLDHVEPLAKEIEEIPEPKRPPRVIVPLSNCELEELMPVILTTTIDAGVPMATFTWYKNNKPLLEGNRFTTKYDILTKVLTLQVLAARPDDQGTYTVRATNPSGSDETTCKLTIRPVASIDTRPFVEPERFAQLELQAPAPTKDDMEHMEPPK